MLKECGKLVIDCSDRAVFAADENGRPIPFEEGVEQNFYGRPFRESKEDCRSRILREYESAGNTGIKLQSKKFTIYHPCFANTLWYSMLAAGTIAVTCGIYTLAKKGTRKKMKNATRKILQRFSKKANKQASTVDPKPAQ